MFMAVLDVIGSRLRDQADLRGEHVGADITLVARALHQRVDQDKSPYNRFLRGTDSVVALGIVPQEPRGGN